MDGLEWDVEVEGFEAEDSDDVWSNQYRWYADILDKTGGIIEEKHGGCDVNLQDYMGRRAIHYAVEYSQVEALRCLISAGYTPLCEAVWNKSVEMAGLLLRSGAKLTQSQHLLHYTVLHRHTSMAELLLQHGAYVNLRDDHGDTPLLLAISCGHLDTIRLLLQYEANPKYANSLTSVTPLHKAQETSHMNGLYDEILKQLCLYNVDLDMPGGGTSTTPLTFALLSQELNCAISLIRAGADVNKYCATSLIWRRCFQSNLDLAAFQGADDVVRLLVAAGFDLSKYAEDYPKDFSTVKDYTIEGWLTHAKFNPRRLEDLCRLKMRSQMGNKALQMVPQLEIPHILKRFLLFEDMYVKKHVPPDPCERMFPGKL